jgi:phosphate butyryltransferase
MITLDSLIVNAASKNKSVVAVASAADLEVLQAVSTALAKGLASFMLFDNKYQLEDMIKTHYPKLLDEAKVRIHHAEDNVQAATLAVKAVSGGVANVLMKGNLATSIILKAALNGEYGLRTGRVLSHVAAFEVPGYNRLLFVTDAAMNIAPDLEAKAQIIRNAVATAHACGVPEPIVAPLAAIETVNPAMIPTTDAASLVVMNRRGQITGCVVDGPLALDNAVSEKAAAQKGITGETAGKADILVVPNLEAGNILYKSLMYFANAKVGAIIQGARAPIVLTSRADSAESKLYSLALAILSAK